MNFWGGKPATVAGMLLRDDSDNLSQVEKTDILAQLPSLDGMNILELGAGIGRYTSHFARIASHVTAVDFVEKFLDQNRKTTAQFSNISYYCANVMDLAFEPESFDFVFMNWLLMYLDDRQMILLRDRIRLWTGVGGIVFFRESCFTGASGGLSLRTTQPDIGHIVNTRTSLRMALGYFVEATSRCTKSASITLISAIGSFNGAHDEPKGVFEAVIFNGVNCSRGTHSYCFC